MSLTRVFFRVAVTFETLLVLVQAVLAGGFLGGHYDMLRMHELNGLAAFGGAVLLLVAALLRWKPGGGPGRPAVASAVVLTAVTLQILLGYTRTLAAHVPLGVLVTVGMFLLLRDAWTRSAADRTGGAR